jgi:hypothetical protein
MSSPKNLASQVPSPSPSLVSLKFQSKPLPGARAPRPGLVTPLVSGRCRQVYKLRGHFMAKAIKRKSHPSLKAHSAPGHTIKVEDAPPHPTTPSLSPSPKSPPADPPHPPTPLRVSASSRISRNLGVLGVPGTVPSTPLPRERGPREVKLEAGRSGGRAGQACSAAVRGARAPGGASGAHGAGTGAGGGAAGRRAQAAPGRSAFSCKAAAGRGGGPGAGPVTNRLFPPLCLFASLLILGRKPRNSCRRGPARPAQGGRSRPGPCAPRAGRATVRPRCALSLRTRGPRRSQSLPPPPQ